MDSLQKIYEKYQAPRDHGDKGTTHSYIQEYERLLEPYRNNSTVLEIGLFQGLSLKMWKEYFINSNVMGVDIHLSDGLNEMINQGETNIFIADATSEQILNIFHNVKFDVVIDDGSHRIEDQVKSFNLLKPKMKEDGIYIIEDVANLDIMKIVYDVLHKNMEIIDNRHIKGRFDDVLIAYRF